MKNFLFTLFGLSLILFLFGCSNSQQTLQQKGESKQENSLRQNREASLQHFIAGSTFDAKNDFARAALEYQEALQYDDDPAISYALSRDYLQLNKLELAEQNAWTAVSHEPNNRDYRENLAQIFLSEYKLDSSLVHFNKLVNIDSSYMNGWFDLAHATQYKSPTQALSIYRSMIDRFGSNWDVWEQIALISVQQKKFSDAANAYKEMLTLDPSNSQLEQTLAITYEASGNDSLALNLYRKLANDSDNVDAKISAARLFLLKHKYTETDSMIHWLINEKQDSSTFELKIHIGETLIDALQKDSMIVEYVLSYFLKLKEEKQEDWRPYWFLGAIYASEDKFEDAKLNYKKVIEIDSSNIEGWINLASLFSEKRKYAEMAELLEEATKIHPTDFRINFFLGVAYYRNGEFEKAIDPLERAISSRQNDMNALSTLALIYDALKRWTDSDRIYEEALKLEPNNHLIMNNYSYSLSVRGEQLPRALEMSKKAVEQQPKNASYLDTMGWIYFRLGKFDDAKNYIIQAVDAGNASAEVNEHLGDVYYRLNDSQKAVEYWKKAVELDSKRESAKERLKKGGL